MLLWNHKKKSHSVPMDAKQAGLSIVERTRGAGDKRWRISTLCALGISNHFKTYQSARQPSHTHCTYARPREKRRGQFHIGQPNKKCLVSFTFESLWTTRYRIAYHTTVLRICTKMLGAYAKPYDAVREPNKYHAHTCAKKASTWTSNQHK